MKLCLKIFIDFFPPGSPKGANAGAGADGGVDMDIGLKLARGGKWFMLNSLQCNLWRLLSVRDSLLGTYDGVYLVEPISIKTNRP